MPMSSRKSLIFYHILCCNNIIYTANNSQAPPGGPTTKPGATTLPTLEAQQGLKTGTQPPSAGTAPTSGDKS